MPGRDRRKERRRLVELLGEAGRFCVRDLRLDRPFSFLVEQRPLGFQVTGDEPLLLADLVEAGGEAGELIFGGPALLLDAPSPGPPIPEKRDRPYRCEEKEQSSAKHAAHTDPGVTLCYGLAPYLAGTSDET